MSNIQMACFLFKKKKFYNRSSESMQVTTIGRVASIRDCCGYGPTVPGPWCPRTRRGPRTRSPGPAGVCASPRTPRPRYTLTRAPSAVTDTGTCASTRTTPLKRRWPGYTRRLRTEASSRSRRRRSSGHRHWSWRPPYNRIIHYTYLLYLYSNILYIICDKYG